MHCEFVPRALQTFLSCAASVCLKPDDWQCMLNWMKNSTSRRWLAHTAAVVLRCSHSSCSASSRTYIQRQCNDQPMTCILQQQKCTS